MPDRFYDLPPFEVFLMCMCPESHSASLPVQRSRILIFLNCVLEHVNVAEST